MRTENNEPGTDPVNSNAAAQEEPRDISDILNEKPNVPPLPQEDEAAADDDDVHQEAEFEEEPEEVDQVNEENNDVNILDLMNPDDTAEFLRESLDWAQTELFTALAEKSLPSKYFSDEEWKRVNYIKVCEYNRMPVQLEDHDFVLLKRYGDLEKTVAKIPFTTTERKALDKTFKRKIKTGNIKVSENAQLVGVLVRVIGQRALMFVK